MNDRRPRTREMGVNPGTIAPGPLNAITDVADLRVGHETIIRGDDVRTGVTAIFPHGKNLFREKVPAAVFVGNGYGKLIGLSQIEELGEIETPILLTNTLSVGRVADALVQYMLSLPGNEDVLSINPVVGETNDGFLNDIRGRHVGKTEVFTALKNARQGQIEEGTIGAGTGTVAFGFKGGIGTSSRKLPEPLGGYMVGAIAQTNFDGILTIVGAPVGRELGRDFLKDQIEIGEPEASRAVSPEQGGSVVVVIGTDAPVDARNLRRLAARGIFGLARTGCVGYNRSGDYFIAFSTADEVRIVDEHAKTQATRVLKNEEMSPLFLAAIEATEEAVYNSLFRATTVKGIDGHVAEAIPIERTQEILRKYHVT
jgi:D-aminopeptidase